MTVRHPKLRILRRPVVLDRFGIGNTCLQERINEDLIPPPINLGGRAVGWLEHEIDRVLAAFVAGRSPKYIKVLVKDLVAARVAVEEQQELPL